MRLGKLYPKSRTLSWHSASGTQSAGRSHCGLEGHCEVCSGHVEALTSSGLAGDLSHELEL